MPDTVMALLYEALAQEGARRGRTVLVATTHDEPQAVRKAAESLLQKGVDGLVLAADWFSGDGALASPGAIYSTGPFVFYLAYGLANTGRKDDLVTFEVGYYFP